ncbi:hypothetical protein [Lentibacillus amyloliquefaciens]|uniref:Uncharacterized protein n=1 Tax=Lentibacillus amyloliquefaciens TaxID=1472767 RepID=A0A0U4DQT8_9BACI|nr:hypothetical protein [Lentibacillus amyloliquefaciens]ALX47704.1 hypothetical protein AOX59_03250 [Lentibacillus amyloliquefaciens]
MATNWKKRYSFRLTGDDTAIYEFLEQLPSNKRSEAIRYLLGIAVKYLHVEQSRQHECQQIIQALNDIKAVQTEQYEQLRHQFNEGISHTAEKRKEKEAKGDMSEQAVTDTANAFLSSFGISSDD